ncbi:hypothetical protein L6164_017384 [Bauhinia variegata]|uniref:Uncharacterized protein n=1 Tax=Bauhinia variegata TaxID=167791 RepID=A0ACB9N9N8_BAUVA|nr:hypothetical protein L6164_017384 [Bauhinia variegata]
MNHTNLVIDVEAIMAERESPRHECCIYRVPYHVRKLNVEAYIPNVVSIGPLHHYDKRLQNMERCKRVYFKQFVARTKINLEDLIGSLDETEPTLRLSYSENLEMNKEELVKVILVDACFIVELFWKFFYAEWTDYDLDTVLKPWLSTNIRLDLLLLENQVPFFLLEKVYNLASTRPQGHIPSFLELSIKYFDYYNTQELEPNFTISHFTDLLRTFNLQPSTTLPGRAKENISHIQSATELLEAGVTFQVNHTSKWKLDLHFEEGCLRIPEIEIVDTTEILYLNMVALEQCHYPYSSYITDYIGVMDFLINTKNDVDILVQKKIVINRLGDNDAVAKLFNSLLKNVTIVSTNSLYFDLQTGLDAFCKKWWRKGKVTLKRDYCNNTWRTLATIGAIVILFLTFVQTVTSVWQVVTSQNDKNV